MKTIDQKRAIHLIGSALINYGFYRVSQGGGTRYYSKRGTYWKIRVSDHVDSGRNHDVCHDVVMEGPTIMSDIEHRARKANEAFVHKTERKRVATR